MGKQVNFYMNPETQRKFVEYAKQNDMIFLNREGTAVHDADAETLHVFYLYIPCCGEVVASRYNSARIDPNRSPVIEFIKTSIIENQKKILRGRLWVSTQYYDDDGNLTKQNYKVIEVFQKLVRWIRKNVPCQQMEKGNHLVNELINDELIELLSRGFILST